MIKIFTLIFTTTIFMLTPFMTSSYDNTPRRSTEIAMMECVSYMRDNLEKPSETVDAWGNKIHCRVLSTDSRYFISVRSYGPDMQPLTDDDIMMSYDSD